MAAINCTVAARNGIPGEDGPFITADGKCFFCTITVDGTYDQADRPKLVHDNANDLLKVAGIKFVKAIEWMSSSSSSVNGNVTGTGNYKGRLDTVTQRLTILRSGASSTPGAVDEVEIGTGALISGVDKLSLDALVIGD